MVKPQATTIKLSGSREQIEALTKFIEVGYYLLEKGQIKPNIPSDTGFHRFLTAIPMEEARP
jgi:hypothetical protein